MKRMEHQDISETWHRRSFPVLRLLPTIIILCVLGCVSGGVRQYPGFKEKKESIESIAVISSNIRFLRYNKGAKRFKHSKYDAKRVSEIFLSESESILQRKKYNITTGVDVIVDGYKELKMATENIYNSLVEINESQLITLHGKEGFTGFSSAILSELKVMRYLLKTDTFLFTTGLVKSPNKRVPEMESSFYLGLLSELVTKAIPALSLASHACLVDAESGEILWCNSRKDNFYSMNTDNSKKTIRNLMAPLPKRF
tara:strand:- start:108 stop:875 length:768 start_codon:yes stop_codon:yes gene_type:complete